MALSLLKFFKRKSAKEQPAATPPAPVIDKPSSERLSKTVMPNATRTPPAAGPFQSAPPAPVNVPPPAPRPISLSMPPPPAPPVPSQIPPAVALAIEPKIERAIPLALSDVVAQMPAGIVRPLSDAEGNHRVLLKAAELERGMANGKPSVSIATVYEQVPEIFTRKIAPSDSTQVVLPFAAVLEQFTNLQMRADQYREQAVPQVETPFLKVTLEDDSKFGTTTGPLESGSLPPVRVLPATAETIAAAEPEPAVREKAISPAPVARNGNGAAANGNGNGNGHDASAEPFQEQAPAAPTRIPFKLTPNGTGVTAAERVPASTGGTSVPTSLQPAAPAAPAARPNGVKPPEPAPAAPTRIPFKLTPPTENGAAKGEPWLTKENFAASEDAPAPMAAPAPRPLKPAQQISLPLRPILQALPPFQLTGDVNSVSQDTRIELPFALVESQLACGRVHLTPEEFAAALPEQHRGLFSAKDIATPVLLPLQDVLQNLPGTALRMRDDQEEQERGSNFATPFSSTADEDARRFNVASAPVPKPVVSVTPDTANAADAGARPSVVASVKEPDVALTEERAPEPAPVAEVAPAPVLKLAPAKAAPRKTRTPLQKALNTDEAVEPKAVVAHIGKMDGVEGCAIMFGDGLNLAGELPERYDADGLCAMAPSLVQRIENHMVETKLGALRGMTLSCSNASITFFMHDNLCLAALHKESSLAADVRARLDEIVLELSKTYSQSA